MAAPRFARWQPASRRCAGRAGDGARALNAALGLAFPTSRSWGIYNCRPTALGNPSAHGDGRAIDRGCTIPVGARMVKALLDVGPAELGISVIIHDRRIYSRRSPRGRRYSGHPHHDHVHIEMTRKAARRLTLRRAKRVLGLG